MITEFGKLLRIIRINSGDSAKDMATKLNMSASYLSTIENGKRNIPPDMEDLLVRAYNLSEREALKSIQQTDKYRASYYNMNSSKKWGMKESYHIMLDSGMLGIDGIVDILEKIYREKTEKTE